MPATVAAVGRAAATLGGRRRLQLLQLVAFFRLVLATNVSSIRGVSPTDMPRYAPLVGKDGESVFQCLAGSESVHNPMLELPFAAVNDDFCDCADGSDEPGTGACSGQKETLFYCQNEQSQPLYVYASRVNDGVCDCCDGSDEWRRRREGSEVASGGSAACPNVCAEEGRELAREFAQREAELQKGLAQRKTLVEKGRLSHAKTEKELEQLRSELPGLEAAERQAEAAHTEAEAAVQEERRQKESPNTTTSTSSGVVDARVEADGEVVSENDGSAEGASKHATPGSAESSVIANDAAEGGGVSEYTKWMDGADSALGGASVQKRTKAVFEDEEDDEDEEPAKLVGDSDRGKDAPAAENVGFWRRMRTKIAALWERVVGKAKTKLERELDKAGEAKKTAKLKVTKNRDRTEELMKKITMVGDVAEGTANSSMSEEDRFAYLSLEGRCITKKFTQYKYEACFFKNAKQDSMNIGRWKHWEAPHVALFDDGQWCPGGPARSLRIRFLCGAKEEFGDVGEPSRCTYEATITHPAACSDNSLQALERSRGPRRPFDEL